MKNESDFLGLFEWWNEKLTNVEKAIVNISYKPMGASNDGLEAERVFQRFKETGYYNSSATPVDYLSSMAEYISKKDNLDLKIKILEKAESISENFSYTSRHFVYLSFVKLYSDLKELQGRNAELYYHYCRKMVLISDMVRQEMLEQEWKILPVNRGFEGVFEELKMQNKYDEAIKLVIDGREKGWNIQYLIDDVWELIETEDLDPHKFGLKEESEYYTKEEIDNNPYLNISLLVNKIESKNALGKSFEAEANEVLNFIEKSGLSNYIVLESLYKIGSAYYTCGEKTIGLNIWTRIKNSVQDISPFTISNFYSEIGKLLYCENDIDLAYDWFKKGLELNKKLPVRTYIKRIEKTREESKDLK